MKTTITFLAALLVTLTTLVAATNPNLLKPIPNALAEQPAEFMGDNSLIQPWLVGEVEYPALAKENAREGRVVIEFTINEKGEAQNFITRKGIGLGCDEAVIAAIQQMPRWTPARTNGQTVAVSVVVAVDFRLF